MTEYFSFPFFAMGTECVFHVYARGPEEADEISQVVMAEVARIEQRYSRFRTDSVLAEINRTAARGGMLEVDAETAGLLDYACACHKKSVGLFDISAGSLYQAWDFSSDFLPEPDQIKALLPMVGLGKILWTPPLLQFPLAGIPDASS
jgi:thiamine biosynthesis lipoprotein